MSKIPVAGPSITELEESYVLDAVRNCWYADANRYHDLFEAKFAEYTGVRYAIALPSCTSAIHLSLAALNVGPGDEVIVPDVTWIASVAPVSYVGAQPVFADIDTADWCLSPESFAQNITPRTKAVIPVGLYGNMPRLDEIQQIARDHGIAVIEDAAEAFGSMYRGRMAGSWGDTGVFSFHGSKTMTTGEGGMLVTGSEEIRDRALVLRDHGRRPGDTSFFNGEIAWKYKMSSFQAAMGLAQLERAAELIERKRQIFQWYAERLRGVSGIQLNPESADTRNSYWMTTLVLDPATNLPKEQLVAELSARGIDSRPFFHPLSSIPACSGSAEARQARENNSNAYAISPYGVNLPSALSLTEEDVDLVCKAVQEIVCRNEMLPRRVAS